MIPRGERERIATRINSQTARLSFLLSVFHFGGGGACGSCFFFVSFAAKKQYIRTMNVNHLYLEENSNIQSIKYEGNLNFSTATCSEDDWESGPYKKSKTARQDPLSHRIIEKRRRDRMNNCLADLSRLIPAKYLKKGRGRVEKTEIIEMAIKHMKYLQGEQSNAMQYYRLGYQECMSEAIKFMVEVEGHFPRESICVRLLKHLQNRCDQTSESAPAPSPRHQQRRDESPLLGSGDDPTVTDYTVVGGTAGGGARDPRKSMTQYATKLDDDVGGGVSYKYKTSIKLRFNQDCNSAGVNGRRGSLASLEESPERSSTVSSVEFGNAASDSETTNTRRPRDVAASRARLRPGTPTRVRRTPDDNAHVPVFVLHARGSYYVPLTVDYRTLVPFLGDRDFGDSPQNVILHPVTINVNFLADGRGASAQRYDAACDSN